MNIGQFIKSTLKDRKIRQADFAAMLGYSGQSAVASILARSEGMAMNNAINMLDKLGYELVIQPRKPGRRPEGQIVLTNEGEDQKSRKEGAE